MNEIEKKVRGILKESLPTSVSLDNIGSEDLLGEVGINSVDFVKIVVGIEAEFEFEFNDADLNFTQYDTIQKMVSYIESRVNS